MPIGTRLSTPIPRNYLHDERLNSVSDALAREAYLRAKLVCDNLGRLPAHPAMLASTLFPAMPPTPAEMSRIITQWVNVGLVFHYQAGSRWFVEMTDNGETSRLVGNMTGESEYPAPPAKMIAEWKAKFFSDWKPIERRSKRVRTGMDVSDTRSHEEKRREEKGSEGSRAVRSTAGRRTARLARKQAGLETKISKEDETIGSFLDALKREGSENPDWFATAAKAAKFCNYRIDVNDPQMSVSFVGQMATTYEKHNAAIESGDLLPGNFCSKVLDACMGEGGNYPPSFGEHRDRLREQERASHANTRA